MSAKLTPEELSKRLVNAKRIAKANQGKCLSSKYEYSGQKLLFECRYGHQWEAKYYNILNRGARCRICRDKLNGERLRGTIDSLITHAKKKGWKLHSTMYVSAKTKYLWECALGHKWSATGDQISNSGSGCPKCNSHTTEEICRAYLEHFLQTSMNKKRPSWLKFKTNQPLELDGYNKDLKVAFEYQGEFHFREHPKRGKGAILLHSVQERDMFKKQKCKEKGIKLLEITYQTPLEHVGKELLRQLKEHKIAVINRAIPELDNLSIKNYSQEKIIKAKIYAEKKDGKLLSKKYLGTKRLLLWECKEGHQWKALYHNTVHKKQWCNICSWDVLAEERKTRIEILEEYARKNNLTLNSKKYKNNSQILFWKCGLCKKDFNARWTHVKRGHHCPDCGRKKGGLKRRDSIKQLNEAARNRKGVLMSKEYNTAHSKYEWKCKEGHTFLKSWSSVKNANGWCPKCRRLTYPKSNY